MTQRVHSAQQAREMAVFAYGKPMAGVPVSVETAQDGWIVRIGPDAAGDTCAYLIMDTDEAAVPLLDEVVVVAGLKAPLPRP